MNIIGLTFYVVLWWSAKGLKIWNSISRKKSSAHKATNAQQASMFLFRSLWSIVNWILNILKIQFDKAPEGILYAI